MIALNGFYFHTKVLQSFALLSIEVFNQYLIGVAIPTRRILGLKHLHLQLCTSR